MTPASIGRKRLSILPEHVDAVLTLAERLGYHAARVAADFAALLPSDMSE